MPRSPSIYAGLVAFLLGLGFVAANIGWFFAGGRNTPLWLNLCCLLAPIGFAVALWSGLRAGRDEQRAALAAVSETPVNPRVAD
jgi:hypothetical protein